VTDSEFWRDFAACKGETAELFYPDREDNWAIRMAKSICEGCPVATDCLAVALENGEPDGIWGGYTPEEREIVRIANRYPQRQPPEIFPHGTAAGYKRHARAGTRPCLGCTRAHNVARFDNKRKHDRNNRNGNG